MNKNVLTLLGCTGSLSLLLLTGNSASARMANAQDAAFPEANKIEAPSTNNSISQEEPQSSQVLFNQKVELIALAKFGCACANCQNLVRQMISSGQIQAN